MHRQILLAVTVALLVVGASALAGTAASSDGVAGGPVPANGGTPGVAANESGNATGAGALVAGTVAAYGEHVDGGIDRAAFEHAVATARTDEQRARVVSQYVTRGLDRLEELRMERERLDAARADGRLSPGGYRARTARLSAAAGNLERLADRLDTTAGSVPSALRTEYDLTGDRISQLRDGAARLAPADRVFDTAFYARLAGMVEPYNANVDGSSSFVGGQLAGETVNLHVVGTDERTTVSFRIDEDERLGTVRAGGRPDATVRMTADKTTIDGIARADDPREAFLDAVERGDVSIRGLGVLNRLKWFVIGLFRGVVSTVSVAAPI